MLRILLTGMSGTGKSSLIGELAARGYKAVDADTDGLSELRTVGARTEWVWREDRIQALLSAEEADVLFLSGCASNQVQFYGQFDHIVLLSAPAEVMIERLATRATNPYGNDPAEIAESLAFKQTVEPQLRRVADLEIDTTAPLDQLVATVLTLIPDAARTPD